MKKNKEKILITILIILIILIITSTLLYFQGKNRTHNPSINKTSNTELYGTWISRKLEVIKNGEIVHAEETTNKYFQISNDTDIKICYIKGDDTICTTATYTYQDKILDVSSNETYLQGQTQVTLEKDNIILESIIPTSDTTSRLYFGYGNG